MRKCINLIVDVSVIQKLLAQSTMVVYWYISTCCLDINFS